VSDVAQTPSESSNPKNTKKQLVMALYGHSPKISIQFFLPAATLLGTFRLIFTGRDIFHATSLPFRQKLLLGRGKDRI